jgi:hypothetical protein
MKKIILSQKQLDEICGSNSTYLDGLALTPDIGNIFSTEVTTDGSLDDGYPDPTTTDDFSKTLANNWRGNAKLRGMGPITVREMAKKDWENVILNEEHEHGNQRLKSRVFGATQDSEAKGYGATKKNVSRFNIAQNKLKNGNPVEKAEAAKTVKRMRDNWPGIDVAKNQYETAKTTDKTIQKNKIGPKIKSAPKNSGNGKGHSPKNGIITN